MTASGHTSVSPSPDIDPTSITLPCTPERRRSSSSFSAESDTTTSNDCSSSSAQTLDDLTLEARIGENTTFTPGLAIPALPCTPICSQMDIDGDTSSSQYSRNDSEDQSAADGEVSEPRTESPNLGDDVSMTDDNEMTSQSQSQTETSYQESQVSAEPELQTQTEDSSAPEEYPEFRFDWLGTSPQTIDSNIILQQEGELPILIAQRAYVLEESHRHPYDPTPLLTLAYLDNRLGFSDIAVGNSHRALLLLYAAFNRSLPSTPPNLGDMVQKAISLRLNSDKITIVGDEMLALRLQAYTTMIIGLAGCNSLWDGLKQCKIALKLYPKDSRLIELKASLEEKFEERSNSLPKSMGLETRSITLRMGRLFQRPYPWIDARLFARSPQLVREVNAGLKHGNLEIRRAFFGSNAVEDAKVEVSEDGDVGPLGVFATRDIQEGELVMVDKSITGISQVPPSAHLCCDACHACLSPPFMDPTKIVRPTCCKAVAYCSRLCHDNAMRSYHKLLCGKDFDWVFKGIKIEGHHQLWRRWRAVCFLRIMAIIITDNNNKAKASEAKLHPLAHPLVARMTAAYTPNTLRPKVLHDWQLLEEVIVPTKILQRLGVDVFACPEYSQETIQTIFWRCENNASRTETHLVKSQDEVSLININQNYLFFNHSCLPNVHWHGPPDATVNIEFLRGIDGEMLRPGESAVWCSAARAIQKGEECKISYIGDALGGAGEDEGRDFKRSMLAKWCENGCGCRVCNEENEKGVSLDKKFLHNEGFVVGERAFGT